MRAPLISLLAAGLLTIFIAHAAPQSSLQTNKSMSIQIIKQELNLTKESFKSIQLIKQSDDSYVVEVELTQKAAAQMHNLTASNIKGRANIVWNNSIITVVTIQSAIGDKFQITGFDNEQAKSFEKEMQS